jgi:hypothetical protein
MSQRERLQEACSENGQLQRENRRLRAQAQQAAEQILDLEEANFNLRIERDAADVLLGAAIDGPDSTRE